MVVLREQNVNTALEFVYLFCRSLGVVTRSWNIKVKTHTFGQPSLDKFQNSNPKLSIWL